MMALPATVSALALEGARSLKVEPEMIALFALGHLSGAIGRSRTFRLKRGWTESACLWIAVVAKPGMAKSPALRLTQQPLSDYQSDRFDDFDSQLLTYQGELAAWERMLPMERGRRPTSPQATQMLINDTTIEALVGVLNRNERGLMLSRDELSGWWRSFGEYKTGGGHDRSDWLSTWSDMPIIVNRKGTEALRALTVWHPFVAICGGLQPAVLPELRQSESQDDGMMDRFLFGFPESVHEKKWDTGTVSVDTLGAYGRMMARLLDYQMEVDGRGKRIPTELEMTPSAEKLWSDYYEQNREEMEVPGFDEHLEGAWAKADTQAARLALVTHCAREAEGSVQPDVIDEIDILSGWALADYFKYGAVKVRDMMGKTGSADAEERILKYMKTRGKVYITLAELTTARLAKGGQEGIGLMMALENHGHGTHRVIQLKSGGKDRHSFELAGHEGSTPDGSKEE